MNGVERGLDETFPDVYGSLRPEVVLFGHLATGNPTGMRWILLPFQLMAVVLLAIACGNVGTLILARTASRSGVKCAAMLLMTLAEQFTDDKIPMKLRVPTRPSGRKKPMKVARSDSGR